MRIEVLQALVDNVGEYLLVERYIEGAGASRGKDTWEAMLVAPDVPRELHGKQLVDMPYKEVMKFADAEIKTTIHLGKSYQPFQYGIRNKDFIRFEKMQCKPMELVVQCYGQGITDFGHARDLMGVIGKDNPQG